MCAARTPSHKSRAKRPSPLLCRVRERHRHGHYGRVHAVAPNIKRDIRRGWGELLSSCLFLVLPLVSQPIDRCAPFSRLTALVVLRLLYVRAARLGTILRSLLCVPVVFACRRRDVVDGKPSSRRDPSFCRLAVCLRTGLFLLLAHSLPFIHRPDCIVARSHSLTLALTPLTHVRCLPGTRVCCGPDGGSTGHGSCQHQPAATAATSHSTIPPVL